MLSSIRRIREDGTKLAAEQRELGVERDTWCGRR
jgi:hypothetical protein